MLRLRVESQRDEGTYLLYTPLTRNVNRHLMHKNELRPVPVRVAGGMSGNGSSTLPAQNSPKFGEMHFFTPEGRTDPRVKGGDCCDCGDCSQKKQSVAHFPAPVLCNHPRGDYLKPLYTQKEPLSSVRYHFMALMSLFMSFSLERYGIQFMKTTLFFFNQHIIHHSLGSGRAGTR